MVKKKVLTTDQLIEKLNKVHKLASEAIASKDIVLKLGGITLYAGIADFYAIQSARLLEQVILKAQLAEGKEPSFQPHDDFYFYDKQIRTRRIVREIKKFLPFKIPESAEFSADIENINNLAEAYIKSTERFLNYRNSIIHHVGSPKKTWNDIEKIVDRAVITFDEVEIAHRLLFEALWPYRFGDYELQYFYGEEKDAGTIIMS